MVPKLSAVVGMNELECVALSRAVTAEQLLAGYRTGFFPLGVTPEERSLLGIFSPRRRGVLLPGQLHISKSLRSSTRRYRYTINTQFSSVVQNCAWSDRSGNWITKELYDVYRELHFSGHAHSVEVFAGNELVGGLFGVQIGAFFAGESMFHLARDASKVALVRLVEALSRGGEQQWLIDTQWLTPHLATLGAEEIDAREYRRRLHNAVHAENFQPLHST